MPCRSKFRFFQLVGYSSLSFRFSFLLFPYPLLTIHYPLSSPDGWPARKPIKVFWLPSSCYSTVYYRSGILSSYVAVNQKEKRATGPPVQLTNSTRNKPSWIGASVFSLVLLAMLLAFFQVYYIGGSGDGDLLWNTNVAYLLVHGERRGYHASYLGYVGELFKGRLGVAGPPDDRTPFTLIIRITPSGI